ncbi:MAG: hypothetical protein AAF739_02830 [Pseudomonadota bacterium]
MANPATVQQDSAVSSAEAFKASEIVDHMIAALEAVPTVNEPFQHFYVQSIWPAGFYPSLLEQLPGNDSYTPLNIKAWNKDGKSTRDRVLLTQAVAETMGPIWQTIYDVFNTNRLQQAIFEKLKDDVAIRLGVTPGEVSDVPIYPKIVIIRDNEGYQIKPHPDGYPRTVTTQFYLPSDETQLDLGTSLYERDTGLLSLARKRFEEVKRFPFAPNSMYSFAVNDCPQKKSYHGRELVTGNSKPRDSLIITWMSEPVESNAAA